MPDDDFDALDALDIETIPTVVGPHRGLTIETMSMAHQKALKKVINGIDLKPLVEAATPLFDAADKGGAGWAKAIAENANTVLAEVVNLLGGDTLAELAAVMLDTETNRDILVAADITLGPAKRSGRFKTYLGCADLQEYVAEVITPKQAIFAVRKAIEVSDYKTLGKAAFAALISAMQGMAGAAVNGAAVPVPEGVEVDGEAM